MESFAKLSYEPISLAVNSSGTWGMNGEPGSLTDGNLIAQNLLYLAYKEPVTKTDLSRAIGIPLAYIEPILKKLIDGELMKQIGNKIYTDFIIYTVEDKERHIPVQKQLIADNFELFWRSVQHGLDKLRRTEYYMHSSADKRNSLEIYSVMNCIEKGIYTAFSKIYNSHQNFPDRPNGGKWVAIGNAVQENYNWRDHIDLVMQDYSGERHSYIENYLGAKSLELFVYDPAFPIKIYYYGKNGIGGVHDENLLKLLYLVDSDLNPVNVGFSDKLLKSIPWLTECKILYTENGKAKVNIPVISQNVKTEIRNILNETQIAFKNDIKELLSDFLKDKKQEIPKHLTGVPLHKQFMYSMNAFPMAVLRCAMSRGLLHDGGYDQEVQCPYPMILVIDK